MKNTIKKILRESFLSEGIPIYREYEPSSDKKLYDRLKKYYNFQIRF